MLSCAYMVVTRNAIQGSTEVVHGTKNTYYLFALLFYMYMYIVTTYIETLYFNFEKLH